MDETISQPNSEIIASDVLPISPANTDITTEYPEKDVPLLQTIYGVDGFIPTGLQIRCLVAFVRSNGQKSPAQVLRDDAGGSYRTWYRWMADDNGFINWWKTCIDHALKGPILSRVYLAIARRAMKDSNQDAKLMLERFDKDYKPQSGLSIDSGFTPGSVQGSKDRQAAIEGE